MDSLAPKRRQTIRRARLSSQPAFDAYLTYYPPNLHQPDHEHGCTQFSIVLAGSVVERVDRRERQLGPAQVSSKTRGTAHSNAYQAQGALLLSFNFRCEETAQAVGGHRDCHWRSLSVDNHCFALALALDQRVRQRNVDDTLWDFLCSAEPATSGRPPEWLSWVRSELDRPDLATDIGALARNAGVHRVHLSREFVRHFGMPPTMYRQHQMAGRSMRAMFHDKLSAAAAAHEGGFSDQSHMIRTMRRIFGTTPRHFAALLAS